MVMMLSALNKYIKKDLVEVPESNWGSDSVKKGEVPN